MRRVLGIIGLSAVGKSTIADFLAIEYAFRIFEIGDFVRKSYEGSRYFTNYSLIEFANCCYEQGHLVDFLKEAIVEAKKVDNDVVFCGIRTNEDAMIIKETFSNSIILRVRSSYENRIRRYAKEDRDHVELFCRDTIENSWTPYGVNAVYADYEISNDADLESLYLEVSNLLTYI